MNLNNTRQPMRFAHTGVTGFKTNYPEAYTAWLQSQKS